MASALSLRASIASSKSGQLSPTFSGLVSVFGLRLVDKNCFMSVLFRSVVICYAFIRYVADEHFQ